MLAMDSDLPPVVGQQVTLAARRGDAMEARLNLLKQQVTAACHLRHSGAGQYRWRHTGLMQSDGNWQMRPGAVLRMPACVRWRA